MKRDKKPRLSLLALVLLGLVLSACGSHSGTSTRRDGLDPAPVRKLVSGVGLVQPLTCAGQSVVGNGRRAYFSGFLVGSRVVMTAEHGLYVGPSQVACRVRVRLNGRWHRVSEMRLWSDRGRADRRGIDVATLKLSGPARGHVFSFADQSPRVGASVAALGYPLGRPISLSRGTIKREVRQYGDPVLAAAIALEGGDSGGPIVDVNGEVVSVVSRIIVNASETGTGSSFNGGVDLASWWRSAERDLCRTYPDGGLPGCASRVKGSSEKRSIVVTPTSPEPIFGNSP